MKRTSGSTRLPDDEITSDLHGMAITSYEVTGRGALNTTGLDRGVDRASVSVVLRTNMTGLVIGWRLRSAEAVDELIEQLRKCKAEAWPAMIEV